MLINFFLSHFFHPRGLAIILGEARRRFCDTTALLDTVFLSHISLTTTFLPHLLPFLKKHSVLFVGWFVCLGLQVQHMEVPRL